MFESLVVTLREGVEAALVVGIILLYLRRTGREALARWVHLGLGAGIAASLACGAALARLGVAEEAYEGWLMLVAAVFVATLVVFMLRSAAGMKRAIESRVEAIAGRAGGGRGTAAGLFLLTFILVLREGIETVIFLSAVNLTTGALLSFTGGLLGIVLAVVFGISFVRGTARVDLARFFKVTAIVLLVLAAQLLVGALHEFGESGALPIDRETMRLVGPIVKNDALVLVSLLALPLIVLLVPGRGDKARAAAAAAAAGGSGPEARLALARRRRERRWRTLFAGAGILAIAALTASYAFTRLPRAIDPPRLLEGDAEDTVRLPAAPLNDGHLHRFGVPIDGTVVRFFVMRSGEAPVAAFDACQVCGATGYVEMNGRLVCLACAADLNPATLGREGGCNPLPLPFRATGGEIVVRLEDLKAHLPLFRRAPAEED